MEKEETIISSLAAFSPYKGGSPVPEKLSACPRLPCLLSWGPLVTGVRGRGGLLCAEGQDPRRRAACHGFTPAPWGWFRGHGMVESPKLCAKWSKEWGRESQDPNPVTRALEPSSGQEILRAYGTELSCKSWSKEALAFLGTHIFFF